jgi:hypothetical protein
VTPFLIIFIFVLAATIFNLILGKGGLIYAESSDEEADAGWDPEADIAEDADDLVILAPKWALKNKFLKNLIGIICTRIS